jgi:hypothetical protein
LRSFPVGTQTEAAANMTKKLALYHSDLGLIDAVTESRQYAEVQERFQGGYVLHHKRAAFRMPLLHVCG